MVTNFQKNALSKFIFIGSFFLFSFLGVSFSFSENDHVNDSLQLLIANSRDDSEKVNLLNAVSLHQYSNKSDFASAESSAEQAKELAIKVGFSKGNAVSLNNLGNVYLSKGFYLKAIKAYTDALTIFRELKMKNEAATNLNNISLAYFYQSDYEKAVDFTLQSLRINEEILEGGDKNASKGVARCYLNLGNIYQGRNDNKSALEYYNKSILEYEKCGYIVGLADVFISLGSHYYYNNDFEKAIEYFQKSLEIHKKTGNMKGVGDDFNNIGLVYQEMKNTPLAVKFVTESMKISEELGDQLGVAQSLGNIAEMYQTAGDFAKAEEYYLKSIELCKKIGSKSQSKIEYKAIASMYAQKKDFDRAYQYHQLYSSIKDSILNDESTKQMAEMQTKYDTEKKEQENMVLKAKGEKQRLMNLAISIGLVLVISLAFFIYRSYRQKKKANIVLGEQNVEITRQKGIIEEKNKDITDSIRYAKRLQQAILKPGEEIKHVFPESFVLFKPKDIVSGDFYWFDKFGDLTMVAAADCTGHGVPGAFMSIIGCNLLSQAVNEYALTKPAVILNSLNKGLSKILHQRGDEQSVKDGMDIALCVLDTKKMTLEFSAAYNPLWLVREGQIIEYSGNKFPVGAFVGEQQQFTNHEIKLQKGDSLYIFSDGYADQFGGPRGKKFKYKPFQKLVLGLQGKPMSEQREVLNKTIMDWKGNLEQLDDILVIGVRV